MKSKKFPNKPVKYSKAKLRDLAVLLAAYQILHMEDYEPVRKITEEREIPVASNKKTEEQIEAAVKQLEVLTLLTMKQNPIHQDDKPFFIEKCGVILETFFEECTHLFFRCLIEPRSSLFR